MVPRDIAFNQSILQQYKHIFNYITMLDLVRYIINVFLHYNYYKVHHYPIVLGHDVSKRTFAYKKYITT